LSADPDHFAGLDLEEYLKGLDAKDSALHRSLHKNLELKEYLKHVGGDVATQIQLDWLQKNEATI
jgi:hypothetical protein